MLNNKNSQPQRKRQRRFTLKRGVGSLIPTVHVFQRVMSEGFDCKDWAVPQHYARYFSLDQLPSYSEFTTLFDRYKITRVDIKFVCSFNGANIAIPATTPTSIPQLLSVHDYDDETALSQSADYYQYSTFRIDRLDRILNFSLVPRVASAVYNGAFTGYGNSVMWLDMNSTGVRHYGFKFEVDPMLYGVGANTTGRIIIYYTYHLECRDVR